jgi:aspartyl-tRNA(Asn)/glutamyl-tRNA(Gln) amidotransferase subunit B
VQRSCAFYVPSLMTFETVIGLEVHVQLATQSKAFCRDAVVFGAEPNTAVSAVSLAHPGTLPVANAEQIKCAVKLGLALGGSINQQNSFDRKNYFYPDSPKGYQITQDKAPIVIGGAVNLETNQGQRTIRIHHIHMEEDAGKSLHDQDNDDTLIDLNRAGTPLLEIVTEPDFRSGDEVSLFMEELRHLVRWLDISDGNMEEGSLRCDVNISLRPTGSEIYGQRCEIKNMNSMRFARKAIAFEVERQTAILSSGGIVQQQTRGFQPSDGTTYLQRKKEDAHDYRYFPDPDLPPVVLKAEMVSEMRRAMFDLPKAVKETCLNVYRLTKTEADIIVSDRQTALFFLDLVQGADEQSYRGLAQVFIQKIKPVIETGIWSYDNFPISVPFLRQLIGLINECKVSNSMAYTRLFPALLQNEAQKSPAELAQMLDLIQETQGDGLMALATLILERNLQKVTEYRSGKKGLIGFFMGELMKEAGGKANPKEATQILTQLLAK